MTRLAATASTQSRARRPIPLDWECYVTARSGVTETWHVAASGMDWNHKIESSWVLDQGGPVLGYTSPYNRKTAELLKTVNRLTRKPGMYGPGSIVSFHEQYAADLLCDIVSPHIKDADTLVRFVGNGSDATDLAVRLARAQTGRDAFISIGYHGSSIIFSKPPQNAGVPYLNVARRFDVEFGDNTATELAFLSGIPIAAVIVEVPSTDEFATLFLRYLRKLCDRHGALLILDEVVTGFRLCLGGAAEYYGVRPDIACYGKSLGNGRGIAATVGPRSIMDMLADQVFYSNTYNGDPYNCSHIIGTLQYLVENEEDIYGHIWQTGDALKVGLRELGVGAVGHSVRVAITDPRRDELTRALIREGYMLHQPCYPTYAHNEDHVQGTLDAMRRVVGG